MVSRKPLLPSLLTALLLPAVCQASPFVLDINRELVAFSDTVYRAMWPFVEMAVGTPPKNLKFLINTNIGDIVMVNDTQESCGGFTNLDPVCSWGQYNPSDSSTYKSLGQNMSSDQYEYYGNSSAIQDVVRLGGKTFDNMTIVLADEYWPIFGIGGYKTQQHVPTPYSNIPIQLNQDGNTTINGYSLYFGRNNATTPGRLAFGGVETNKFTGTLETLETPLEPDSLSYGNVTLRLANISVSTPSGTAKITSFDDTKVYLFAQWSGFIFPKGVLTQLQYLLNLTQATVLTDGEFPSDLVGPLVPYESAPNDTTLTLQFGAAKIQIPMWDILTPYNETHGYIALSDSDSEDRRDRTPVIGSAFFSNAYSVFDFTHNQLSIAPLRHEALSTDNVTAISSAGVVGLQGYHPGDNGNNQTTQVTTSSGGLSTGAKAGIGVGAALGALLVIGAIVVCVVRRRRRRAKANTTPHGTAANYNANAAAAAGGDEEARHSTAMSSQYGEKTELAGGSENVRHMSRSPPSAVSPITDTHSFSAMHTDNSESMSASTFVGSDRTDTLKRKPVAISELPS